MKKSRINASIITIGDELLIGQTIDTNSAWMAQELNKIGIWVRRRVAVGDVWDDIWQTLDAESKEADIIFITGGLGPTNDDITKDLLCAYFGGKMIVHEPSLTFIKDIFTKLNRPLLERNLKQAEVPDVCKVIPNNHGSAPGMWFEKNETIFISLPGVPYEMKGIMTDYIIVQLPNHFELPYIIHRTAFTAGMGESFIAERLIDFEASLPVHIKLAYLPNYGMVRLRLTTTGIEKSTLKAELEKHFTRLKQLVDDILVSDSYDSLEIVLGEMLKEKEKTVATAESCTGGYIAHLLTSISGSSAYFKGSVVSYADEMKENILQVQSKTLQETGAVSEETVKEMLSGALDKMNTDYAMATSGIMGPTGATDNKPVGTVWIGVGNKEKTVIKKYHFRFDRTRNIEMTAYTAMNMLRKFIMEE